MKIRFFFLTSTSALFFIFIIFSVYSLQINKGEYFAGKAQAQNLSSAEFFPERGMIYFTDKNNSLIPAAINKNFSVIYAVPTEIEESSETSARLANLLGIEAEAIKPLLEKADDKYEEIISKATKNQIEKISSNEIPGIYISQSSGRFYPFNSLASQVLGYISKENSNDLGAGQYGIESEFNALLTGTPTIEENKKTTPAVNGENIILTIDQNIQAQAEAILQNLVETYKPVGGTIIVQDPKTGKILALGNYPSFDPNNYSKSEIKNFINPAVQSLYEPGSIFKVITMAIGLETNAITPQSTYYDKGYLTLDGKTIRNWDLKSHGTVNMTEVIEQSINTGAAWAQSQIGHKTFYDYLLKFGIKELTGIELPGETAGRLTPLEKYPRDINFATASYGQGVSVTPIRLITAISAIANGGMLNQPFITNNSQSFENKRIISEQAAKLTTQMMVSAVKKAELAQIPNYKIAGKTGTAFEPDFVNGGYTDNVINTYVGFAPASNPKFTILIKIDKPEGSPLAGQTVVPAFKELAQFLLNYYNIAPDN